MLTVIFQAQPHQHSLACAATAFSGPRLTNDGYYQISAQFAGIIKTSSGNGLLIIWPLDVRFFISLKKIQFYQLFKFPFLSIYKWFHKIARILTITDVNNCR